MHILTFYVKKICIFIEILILFYINAKSALISIYFVNY